MHLFFFIIGGLAGAAIATLLMLGTDDHLDVEIVDGEFVDGPQGRVL